MSPDLQAVGREVALLQAKHFSLLGALRSAGQMSWQGHLRSLRKSLMLLGQLQRLKQQFPLSGWTQRSQSNTWPPGACGQPLWVLTLFLLPGLLPASSPGPLHSWGRNYRLSIQGALATGSFGNSAVSSWPGIRWVWLLAAPPGCHQGSPEQNPPEDRHRVGEAHHRAPWGLYL